MSKSYFQIIYKFIALIPFLASLFFFGCKESASGEDYGIGIDTLKVVTLYGPTSYFDYRGEAMGIDYENVKRFAEENGMVLQISTERNITDLIEKLKKGEAHLAAYPIPSISEYKDDVVHCGPVEISTQVLLQKANKDKISDVTELVGKDVYVERDSKYLYRLNNLNEELGGGINIKILDKDTLDNEEIIKMVSKGEIDYAVIDSRIAGIYKTAFPDIDTSVTLSAQQSASWAVAKGLDSLASKIDRWENKTHTSEFIREIYKRYYDRAVNDDFDTNLSYFKKLKQDSKQRVSEYDGIFKKYSDISGYDWKLLAAIAYCESRYNPTIASRFGAYGLMQVMPSTAAAVGIDPGSLGNPDSNVKAAAKILAQMDKSLAKKIDDPQERMKFVVASYNSGLGHIYDSIALADKTGLDPQKWTGNVSIAALLKSRPEYYNDPVVKNGYFRGRETVDFVDHVMSIYNYLQNQFN